MSSLLVLGHECFSIFYARWFKFMDSRIKVLPLYMVQTWESAYLRYPFLSTWLKQSVEFLVAIVFIIPIQDYQSWASF